MMTCNFTPRLVAYYDNELPRPLARAVRKHVFQCDACRDEMAQLRGLSQVLDDATLTADPSSGEPARMHAAVDSEPGPVRFS